MADIEEALAAALAAAGAAISAVPSVEVPEVKQEPLCDDPLPVPEPPPPQSLRKRSRTPNRDDEELESVGKFKRLKTEPEAVDALDDIARLVEQAQASVMQQIMPTHSELDAVQAILESEEPTRDEKPSGSESGPYDVQSENAEPPVDSLWTNPREYTRRKHIIPSLGTLAVDILVTLSEQSFEDTMAMLSRDSDSETRKEYGLLRAAFYVQRKLLSDGVALLNAEDLKLTGQTKEIVRIANLASTCASLFDADEPGELGLAEVNEHFLRIFIPEGQGLSDDAAELYLALKTQLFLSTLEETQGDSREQALNEIFVSRLAGAFQRHHPDVLLTASELEFISNARIRKNVLWKGTNDASSIDIVGMQFTYEAFLDILSTFLNDHIEEIKCQGTGTVEMKPRDESIALIDGIDQSLGRGFDLDAMIAEASRAATLSATEPKGEEAHDTKGLAAFLAENIAEAAAKAKEASADAEISPIIVSAAESASRATMLALQGIQQNHYQSTSVTQNGAESNSAVDHSNNNQPQQQFHYQQQATAHGQAVLQGPNGHLPPHQSDSTPALYERARQAAAARSSTHARREGSHSTRRPWSHEEEKALMMGLDLAKGPHWSQILTLFGPNGSISTVLAERTQVQLKDKARNLKLFFLKTGSELPFYLQCVTGELKTRAPTQAARKEAEEKAKLNSEEQQAHVNGVLTLAGGLQHHMTTQASSSNVLTRSGTPGQAGLRAGSQPATPTGPPHQLPPHPPRPVAARTIIPAPQPVSLPSMLSAARRNASQSPAPKPGVQVTKAEKVEPSDPTNPSMPQYQPHQPQPPVSFQQSEQPREPKQPPQFQQPHEPTHQSQSPAPESQAQTQQPQEPDQPPIPEPDAHAQQQPPHQPLQPTPAPAPAASPVPVSDADPRGDSLQSIEDAAMLNIKAILEGALAAQNQTSADVDTDADAGTEDKAREPSVSTV